jgi:hypothetical protein
VYHRFTANKYNLTACPACGFTQVTSKPPDKVLARIYSREYFDSSKYQDSLSLAKEQERRLGFISQYIYSPRANLLEAGCASGEFLKYIGTKYIMWGSDVWEYAINKARASLPCAVLFHPPRYRKREYDIFERPTTDRCDQISADPSAVLRHRLWRLSRNGSHRWKTGNTLREQPDKRLPKRPRTVY